MKKLLICIPILIILYGCGGSNNIQYPEPSSTARDGSFYSKAGTYEFGYKEYLADFGTITVPENRSNPESRLIHLPVIRIHAWMQNLNEPLFGFTGGPGMSNMYFHPIDSLLFDHDFVMVGYRGVDGSSVLNFPEVEEVIGNSEEGLLSERTIKELAEAWTAGASNLKSSGVDINGYTIPQVVEDFETVREALNYDRINLISESYGTRVAYIYGIMHPESIHRSVMIGVNPPGGFIWDPEKTDGIIKYYSNLWAKDSVMSKKCPDLTAAMKKVLKNMPDKWLFFSIDPDKVKLATFGMLFHRNTAALVFDSYVAAEQGDYSGLALMSFAFGYVMPEQVWGDCFAKAVSADLYYWEKSNFTSEPEILGSPFNDLYWKSLEYGHFSIEMIPDSLRVPLKSDVETLLLSGNVDVTNPPQCGAELLSYLKNGKQIIMSEAGHVGDIRYLQLDATKGLIADYINKGIADTSKIKYVPMNFEVGWGLTGVAKAALYTVSAVVLLLAAGVLWWAL